jgi:hypothetical protein
MIWLFAWLVLCSGYSSPGHLLVEWLVAGLESAELPTTPMSTVFDRLGRDDGGNPDVSAPNLAC